MLRGRKVTPARILALCALLSAVAGSSYAGEKSVGTACSSDQNAADFDTIAQCDGTTYKKAPLFIGAVAVPPYAATTCDAGKAGMLQYTGGSFQGCNGSAWSNFAGTSSGILLGTATGATNPQRNGDVTTGLFSPAASTVAIATAGAEALRVTATGSVGIGVTSPATLLSVGANGSALVSDGTSSVSTNGVNISIDNASKYALGVKNSNVSGNGLFLYSGHISGYLLRGFDAYGGGREIFRVKPGGSGGVLGAWGAGFSGDPPAAISGGAYAGTLASDGSSSVDSGGLNIRTGAIGGAYAGAIESGTTGSGLLIRTGHIGTTTGLLVQSLYGSGTNIFQVKANGTTGSVYVNGNVGIGTTAPTNILSLGGDSARTFWMERNGTANTAGNALTVQAGGATSAATDKSGGDLLLSSGIATGTGTSKIQFLTASATGSGTADNAPSAKMTILGNGNVGIGTTSPAGPLDVYGSGASVTRALALYNTSTADGNGSSLDFRGLTTVGTDIAFAQIRGIQTGHNNAAQNGGLEFWTSDPGFAVLHKAMYMTVGSNAATVTIGTNSASDILQVGGASISNKYLTLSGNQWGMGYISSPGGAQIVTSKAIVARVANNGGDGEGFLVQGYNGLSGYNNWFEIGGATGKAYFGGSVGIGTTSPTNLLSLGGDSARTFWMERTTTGTAGNSLTVQSGGALSGATNAAGGDLILSSGIATGTGTSKIQFLTASATGSGTADNAPSAKMTIDGAGSVGIGTTSPTDPLHIVPTADNIGLKIAAGKNVRLTMQNTGGGNAWTFSAGTTQLTMPGMNVLNNGNVQLAGGTSSAVLVDIGPSLGSQTVRVNGGGSSSNDGMKILFANAGTAIGSIGNYSSVVGGAYNNRMTISGAANGVLIAPDGGNVGIGTTAPAVSLDVGSKTDGVRIATGTTAQRPSCVAGIAGTLRWNTDTTSIEVCDGTSWFNPAVNPAQSGGVNGPNAFSFTDVTGAALSSSSTSNTITLAGGFSGPLTATCNGACNAIARNGVWGTSPYTGFNTGDTVTIRVNTPATTTTTITASVSVGSTTSGTWSVTTSTTAPCSAGILVGQACPDGTIYAGMSPDTNVPMYTTRCDVGMSWNGSACTGSRSTPTWNNGTGIGTTTGVTSSITGRANTTVLVNLTDSNAPYNAANACKNLTDNGYTNWYLPAKDELNVLYTNRSNIGGFDTSSNWYWASTEVNGNNAWVERFNDGGQGSTNGKTGSFLVRCVRR